MPIIVAVVDNDEAICDSVNLVLEGQSWVSGLIPRAKCFLLIVPAMLHRSVSS